MVKRRPSSPFSTINPYAAGIDIGATHHVVAVSADRDPTPVRACGAWSGRETQVPALRGLARRLRGLQRLGGAQSLE